MDVHILNGDALADKFPLEGNIVVCRECLVDGPVRASSLSDFWLTRERYLTLSFPDVPLDYKRYVKGEFDCLHVLPEKINVHLWFENDLFCQVNYWFVIHHLKLGDVDLNLYRVAPSCEPTPWSGFGKMTSDDLITCYENRVLLSDKDHDLGVSLWNAYQQHELRKFSELSEIRSDAFPALQEVVQAHLERVGESKRPERRLREILAQGEKDFRQIYQQFSETEAIYGFGDLQVKNMLALMK